MMVDVGSPCPYCGALVGTEPHRPVGYRAEDRWNVSIACPYPDFEELRRRLDVLEDAKHDEVAPR